jgi:hypothetical protein
MAREMSLPLLTRAVCLAVLATGCSASQPSATPSGTVGPTVSVQAVTSPTPLATPPPQVTVAPGAPGAITGSLAYPSEVIPPLRVYAIDTAVPANYRVIHTSVNQKTYLIAGVAPGTYVVYASGSSSPVGPNDRFGGAYTKAVPCGLGPGCNDHAPIPVQVRSGAVASSVDVLDWYAPPGAFPKVPSGREPFKAGDQVVVDNLQADGVNARDAATLGGKILRTLPNGTQLTIQGGPVTADGYDWYPTQISPDPDVKNAFVAGYALRGR